MISKTRIDNKLERKENPNLRKIIILLKKQKEQFWVSVANMIASPKRKSYSINIHKINKFTKANDKVLVPGKILSEGILDHAITIASFSLSQKAKEKLKNSKIVSIEQLLKENPSGKGIKVII